MNSIQLKNDDLKIVVTFPQELPAVPPCCREVAFAEFTKIVGDGFARIAGDFAHLRKISGRKTQVSAEAELPGRDGLLLAFLISDRYLEETMASDWLQALILDRAVPYLAPENDLLQHLRALAAQEIAEHLGVEPDKLESKKKLDEIHDLWLEDGDIQFFGLEVPVGLKP